MKTIVSIFILFTMAYNTAFAQTDFEFKVLEENRSMSKGNANALIINLPNTSYKQVNKLWNKYIKNFKGKLKYNRKIDEYFSDNAEVKDMSENAVDIISKVYDNGAEGTTVAIWFNLGVTYLSAEKYPERYPSGEKILKDFSLLVSADMIAAQLKEEEKRLENMNDTLKSLEKAKVQSEANITKQKEIITKAEASIVKSEKDIEGNLDNQGKQKLNIKEQEKVIETIKRKLKTIQK
jgi:hypothetical protein